MKYIDVKNPDAEYECPHCKSKWTIKEMGLEYNSAADLIEHEGCPDCLWECERCGMLKDGHGTFEHCL